MTVPLTGSNSLSVRLGPLFGGILDPAAFAGGPPTSRVLSGASLKTRFLTTIPGVFTTLMQIISSKPNLATQTAVYQNSLKAIEKDCALAAAECLQAMVAIDTQGVNSGAPLQTFLSAMPLSTAVQTLILQMLNASASVQSGTVSAGSQTAIGTPVGNPVLNLSMLNPRGQTWALALPETITFTCIADSLTGGRALGNEVFSAFGQASVPALSFNWPGGSACNTNFNAVLGAYDNSNGNMLVNGLFTAYSSANYPQNWKVAIGAPGTDLLNGGATSYLTTGSSIEFVGNTGGTNLQTCILQPFGEVIETGAGLGGTPATLQPNTLYGGCLFYKLSSASPAAGALEVALVDGSAGIGAVVHNDQGGSTNVTTQVLTGVGDTNWHALLFVIVTPENMPITNPVCQLRIRTSTQVTTGTNVFVSNVTLTPMVSLYPGGPSASMHSGSTRTLAGIIPDQWTSLIANNYGTSGDGLFQFCFEQAMQASGYSLQQNGLMLPNSGSPTFLDTVIV
jgi:hypothetical protein